MVSIDLSTIKKEYLLLTYIILILGIGFFSYQAVFSPLLGRIEDLSMQIRKKEKDVQRAQVSPQALKSLKNEVKRLEEQMKERGEKLRTMQDVPRILTELNRIAERLKVKIISINPLDTEETIIPNTRDFLLQIPIRIKLKGGYHELGMFVNRVENSSGFMKVNGLKINADSRNIWVHQAELVVTTFKLVSQ